MLDFKDFSNLENSVKFMSKVLSDWSGWNVFFVFLKPSLGCLWMLSFRGFSIWMVFSIFGASDVQDRLELNWRQRQISGFLLNL